MTNILGTDRSAADVKPVGKYADVRRAIKPAPN